MQQVWTIPAPTLSLTRTRTRTRNRNRTRTRNPNPSPNPNPRPNPSPTPDQVWTIPARFSDDKDEMRIAHKRLRELCEVPA